MFSFNFGKYILWNEISVLFSFLQNLNDNL